MTKTERDALIQILKVAAFRHTITPVDGEIRVVYSPEIENPFPGEQYRSYSREPLVLLHDVLTNEAAPPALPDGFVPVEKYNQVLRDLISERRDYEWAVKSTLSGQREGWVLVPTEPTPEMIQAIRAGWGWRQAYIDMIAAAPTPDGEKGT